MKSQLAFMSLNTRCGVQY